MSVCHIFHCGIILEVSCFSNFKCLMTPNQEFHSSRQKLFNTFSSTEQEEVQLVLKGGYPYIKSLDLFIPQNLDIDKLLRENPPNKRLKRDKLIYILHLINWLHSRKKDNLENSDGYTHISRFVLNKTIKNYKDYIEYLKNCKIIEEDKNYIVGKKSRGIRFTNNYQTPIKPIKVTDWALIKNIVYLRKHYDFSATMKLSFLKKNFEKLNVDISGAKEFLDSQYLEDIKEKKEFPHLAYNSRLLPILKLYLKDDILFFVDNTSGRLHTNLTQLKTKLRKFVRYDGKVLYSIDLTNSQPFLLQSLLEAELFIKNKMEEKINSVSPSEDISLIKKLIIRNSNKEDVQLFRKIVSSGEFYEKFSEILKSAGELENEPNKDMRSFVKDITFSSIFSKNTSARYNKAIVLFKKTFPTVYKIISKIKKERHATLAIILQRLESELFLQKCCKIIYEERPDIPIFTLHDSIITTKENIEYVKSIIEKVLLEHINAKPHLKVERWE